MSSIKSEMGKVDRTPFNTTIRTDLLNDFKRYSKDTGVPMNVLVELFMAGVVDGKFDIAIVKGGVHLDFPEE